MEDLLQVGILSSTHGVRGEMKVFPTTDDVKRFKKNKDYILETPQGNKEVKVTGVKFFKQFAILKFEGFDTLDDILPYKGCRLFVTREHAVKCEKDEYFIADVMQTGANDVYVIKSEEGKEYLFPAIKECILKVDMKEQKIFVHVMPGLMDDAVSDRDE